MSALETRSNSGALGWKDRALLIGALFLLSGLTGLAYEVIWFRRFAAVWGSSSLAIATVVASFLAGLGLGAWLTGRFIRPRTNCLALYGLFELGIAFLALAIPFEVGALQKFVVGSLPTMYDSPALLLVTRSALTLCVLGPPCLLMGGTLPLLVQEWTGAQESSREATSTLYALNTWGAAIGCLSAGFFLLPLLGLNATNLAIAAIGGAVGMTSLYVAWEFSQQTTQAASQAAASTEADNLNADDNESISATGLYTVSALTGFAALALQMTWSRQLAVAFGSSTYGFTATLFIILVGIALGSCLFRLFVRKHSISLNTLMILVFVLCLYLTAGTRMLPALCTIVGHAVAFRSTPFGNAGVCIVIAGILQLVPATCMGILFPMLVQLANRRSRSIGRTVGNIYAANTLGAVAGTLVTADFLFPMMGTLKTISACMIVYFAALLLLSPMKSNQHYARIAVMTVCWLCMSLVAGRDIDPRQTNLGAFLYGAQQNAQSVLFFKEGPSSNVLVTKSPSGERALRVNGKVDASSSGDMAMQVGLSYFPMLLRPDGEDVCIVGFGSGATAGTCLRFPGAHVTCCEIEPAVVSAAGHFSDENHDAVSSSRLSVVLEDARSHLQRTKHSYDLILSEPSNPWIAGVSALFTSEFYEAVKARLNDNGIFAQWIQMYNLSQADYVMILRTLRESFPHCLLVQIFRGADSIVIASKAPLVDAEMIGRAEGLVASNEEIRGDLQTHFNTTSVRSLFLRHFTMETAGIDALIGKFPGGPVNTDINLRLEFDAPLGLFQNRPPEQSVGYLVTKNTTAKWYCSLVDRLKCGSDQLPAMKMLVEQFAALGEFSEVVRLADRALKIDPDEPYFQASKLVFDRERPVADQAETIDRIGKQSVTDLNRAGVLLFTQNRFADAVIVFQKLVELHPESATSRLNLAVNLARDGKVEQAQLQLATARTMDPLNQLEESAKNAIERSLKQSGTSAKEVSTTASSSAAVNHLTTQQSP